MLSDAPHPHRMTVAGVCGDRDTLAELGDDAPLPARSGR
jgi:hypothetical protein